MLTEKELQELRDYRKVADDDNILFKEIIKKKLYKNKKIIHVLNNPDLDEDCPDEYLNVNILPRIIFPDTQTDVQNYICFKVEFDDFARYNKTTKYSNITFFIFCDSKTVDDKETGISRHDLLASLIREEFNHSNYFGNQCTCISSKEGVTDTNYCSRTLIFEVALKNNLIKTENGETRVINSEVRI